MLNSVRIAIVFFLFCQQICHCYTKTIPHSTKELYKTSIDKGEHENPTTSYYRHNLFGPNTYAFGFEVSDKATGNKQFRDERRFANGSIQGSYGYVRPDGRVMVTHFMADSERGYLSQTQNFEPGDEAKWQENWPTKKPTIFIYHPQATIQPAVFYDHNEKLNLTSILLPVEAIQKDHGIDLNPTDLEKELLNPAVLEVANGQTPLVSGHGKTENSIGFETVNKFIPSDFPLIPFELPQDETKMNHQNKYHMKINETVATNKYNAQKINNAEKIMHPVYSSNKPADKYIKLKENNSEKSLSSETSNLLHNNDKAKEVLNNLHKAKAIPTDGNANAWYDKIINQTRQEYLKKI